MTLQSGTPVEFIAFSPITREQLRLYADASGDFNPIHLDEEVAKKVGLPGIIAHGMLIAGLISERAVRFAQENSSLKEYKISHFQARFKAMTFLGDVPSVGGVIKEYSETQIVLDLQARNQKGETTTTAVVRMKR